MARPSIQLITAFLLAGQAASASAEPMGRLFFSPEERAMLDLARHKGGQTGSPSGQQVTLSGFVKRSSGKSTAWINQVPQHENETPQGIAVSGAASRPAAVPLLLPSGKQVTLKPGQSFDPAKGEIREGYQGTPISPPSESVK